MKKIKIKSSLDSTLMNPFCGVKTTSKVLLKKKLVRILWDKIDLYVINRKKGKIQ